MVSTDKKNLNKKNKKILNPIINVYLHIIILLYAMYTFQYYIIMIIYKNSKRYSQFSKMLIIVYFYFLLLYYYYSSRVILLTYTCTPVYI